MMAEKSLSTHSLDNSSTPFIDKGSSHTLAENSRAGNPEYNEKTRVLVNTAAADPSVLQPEPVASSPPRIQKLFNKRSQLLKKKSGTLKNDLLPAPPSIALSRRQSYAPVVPSPLNPAFSGSEESSLNSSSSHRESLSRKPSDAPEDTNFGTVGMAESKTPYAASSFAEIGREYDRYPARTPRSSMILSDGILSNGPPSRPRSSNLLIAPSDANPVVDESDPERGFTPFMGGHDITKGPMPGGFPLYMDEKEPDDYLHNPDENFEKERQNTFKQMGPSGFLRFVCFVLCVIGLLCLFILFPVLTFTGLTEKSARSKEPNGYVIQPWEQISTSNVFPILSSIRTDMVDPSTPDSARTRQSVNGGTMKLVFSDEFNTDGRSFYDGDDQFWTAADLHYAATNDLEWYEPDAVTTQSGTLRLKLDAFRNHDLNYRSGMLQSWNKLCFKGGVLEVSASLPGPGGKMGLWPGIWSLGNLARPGHLATSEGVWPYAYDNCDVGITPNQSSPDGISYLPGQKLAKCTCDGEDHPNPGTGRGAPEIDVLEASSDGTLQVGVASQSSQIAPYDLWYLPDYDFLEIHNHSVTEMNTYTGGPFQQAISGVTSLNNAWYDGKQFQKYAYEYTPGKGSGHITWFVGDEPTFKMRGEATGANGNVGARDISQEPMSIVLNLGLSNSWAYIDWLSLLFPTTMYIDYVRIYQFEDQESITCDPEGYPTTDYINQHLNAYTNANLTSWKGAGYNYPKNDLMHGC